MYSSVSSTSQQSQPKSETINHRSLLSPVLDAPFHWHVDSDYSKNSSTRDNGMALIDVGDNRDGEDKIHTTVEGKTEEKIYSEKIGSMHPVFVVPWGVAEKGRRYFERFIGFRT